MANLTSMIVGLVIATMSKLAADEVKAWLPSMSRWILAMAVSRLPEAEKRRYLEEWEADLQSYPGEIVRCLRALGMCWASIRIKRAASTTFSEAFVRKFSGFLLRVYLRLFLILVRRLTKQVERKNAEKALARTQIDAGEASHLERVP